MAAEGSNNCNGKGNVKSVGTPIGRMKSETAGYGNSNCKGLWNCNGKPTKQRG